MRNTFVKNKDKPIKDIVYDNGESAKVVCVFGEKLIEEIHNKAGDDDLTKPWIRRAVKSIIAHGKQVAEIVYRNSNH